MKLSRPYVTPRGFLFGGSARDAAARNRAIPYGEGRAFTAVELTDSSLSPIVQQTFLAHECPAASLPWLEALAQVPTTYAGLSLADPLIMGVVNVTPDSFSDGGQHASETAAIAHARALVAAGAAIIDVGGESTRPGAAPVAIDEEAARVLPVIRALAASGVCVSIDTRHAPVMAAAIAAGARIINDISALTGEGTLPAVARTDVSVVLMHMQGDPRTMQDHPRYIWAPGDVFDFLEARIEACIAAGIARERIAIDPGIGFGKDDTHNTQIIDHLGVYRALGCPIVFGASRKSFIARMSRGEEPQHRLGGSLSAALSGVRHGARILRVHDVAETRQALAVAKRIAVGA
ncbi:MAG: dihydropteroate synthase [Rhodospirillaceae bacterium]